MGPPRSACTNVLWFDLAYRPDFPTALVILCQQLVTRRMVTSQLRQRARLVLLWHAPRQRWANRFIGAVWRMRATDAIKPWQYKYWSFPRDPHFAKRPNRCWPYR